MRRKPSVLLISMPWAPFDEPSLGLGILCSQLEAQGFDCRVRHFNLKLLKHLKASTYIGLASEWALNDFLFTHQLDAPEITPVQRNILLHWAQLNAARDKGDYKPPSQPDEFLDYALTIRNEIIPEFLNDCLRCVIESDASMIGFSCMFDQTIPSLALAQLIKSQAPERLIVFGGYAIEGPVGRSLLECFPYVDVVAYGEGENKIPLLAEASLDHAVLKRIPRIEYRNEHGRVCRNEVDPGWIDLNQSPPPNYRDYFVDLESLATEDAVFVMPNTLPVESSRGCWWGRRSHCTFCGIDEKDLVYRAKTAENVVAMLDTMCANYGIRRFRFSDYILPRQYFKTLFLLLARSRPPKYDLHWETKSNNRLTDIQLMCSAGIRDVQPGIESFSSNILKKMGKGVSAIQNLYTIKMLMQHGIKVHYNILYGFPDDEARDYLDMCRILPLAYHLSPPHTYESISVTRFSPIQKQLQQSGRLKASAHYSLVFSENLLARTGFNLEDYCYIFERSFVNDDRCQTLYGILIYQIVQWDRAQASRTVELSYEQVDGGIIFRDSRLQSEAVVTRLDSVACRVYQAVADDIVTDQDVARRLSACMSSAQLREHLDHLVALGFVFREKDRYFGLAFPVSYYAKQSEALLHSEWNPVD
jgi:ribosomal peptide maturation radical SAM protein 1